MQQNTKPLTMRVYERIYSGIINGEITGNDVLTEAALVEQMQVSKSPVREALILLCNENLLQAIPRVGYRVVQISSTQVEKLIETRQALEPFLLRRAWPSIGAAEVAALAVAREECRRDELVHTTIQDNWRRNIDFHMMLASLADNEYLLDALRRTLNTCARAASQYYLNIRGIPRGDRDLHDDILQAIRAGDLEAAVAALEEDLRQII